MILETHIKPKKYFDVNSRHDLRIAKMFFENWSWGGNGCPFVLEQPHLSVPEMMREKIINKMFKLTVTD
jgi:hypothetical protein